MSKEAKLKFFGDNKDAMEQAEKDMRTITQKRTLSQGGVLPSSKTKYKKRSVCDVCVEASTRADRQFFRHTASYTSWKMSLLLQHRDARMEKRS